GNINLVRDFTAWYLNRGQEADPCWLDASVRLEYPVPRHLVRYVPEWWHQVLVTRAHRRVETDWFAPGTYVKAIEWLEQNYTRDDFLLWVDTFDPHEPWDPPQHYTDLYDPGFEGRRFDAPTYGLRKKMGITNAELRNIRARYAGEVSMVDTWVGQLLAAVERLGIADETAIVFTSDHGTMFDGPGDNGLLCKPNTVGADGMCMSAGQPMKPPLRYFPIYRNVARVPLMLRLPGMQRGKRVKAIVQPWDMTVTLLDLFGMKKPAECIGESLLPLIGGKQKAIRDTAICGTNMLAQAMTDRWTYSVWQGQRGPSLIDHKADPLAKRNVLKKHPAIVKRLHGKIVDFMRGQDIADEFVAKYR
ncbi:sulfatase-like hydrolase/transferase, partial [bacterium]|nr:sulfatase-like hydrolase/transferase [bacterium]